jgi:membrane-bound lytic murein transglycosylase D
MKRLILLLTIASFCFGAGTQLAIAQDPNDDAILIPESWDMSLDSLFNSWYVKRYTKKLSNSGYQERIPLSPAIYMERLSKLNTVIEMPYNDIVRNCIDLYVDRRRNVVELMLGLETFYFPMIEEVLDKYKLPDELKYLTIVESALNPNAISSAGAAGIWQFIHPTGKQYGLEINSLIDERLDPVKATYAACEYFTNMYRIFGDWTLAIAAYNCGSGNVSKAITRANGSKDFWKIYPYLPRETRSYVPFFIAVNYAMNYYAQHQLYPVQTSLPPVTDTVMIQQTMHFDQIAAVLGVEKEYLRALNPQYKREIIPGDKYRPLRLPALKTNAFITLQDSIAKYKVDEIFTNRSYVGTIGTGENEKIIHRVRKGESMASIAAKYGVSTAKIRSWNGLKSKRVAVGKRLTIYVDSGGYANTSKSSTAKSTASQPAKKETKVTQSTSAKTTSSSRQPAYSTYKVKTGDSLFSIAKKYPGYTYTDLMKMNHIKDANSLKVGQSILVPKI